MKLLMNLSTLGARPTGLGVYAAHCARAACEAFDVELIAPESYQGPGRVVMRSPAGIVLGAGRGAAVRRWMWARGVAAPARRVLYSPTHQGFPSADAQVLTIHDLISLRFPKTYPLQSAYFKHVLPRHLQRCRAVFTVSQTSRADIHAHFGYPLDAIHVVPNGVDRTLFRRAEVDAPRDNFLLMVGASFSHKNVDELLRHDALWRERYTLVVASCRGAYRRQLEDLVTQRGLRERVRFLDYVEPAELVRLYQRCAAFVYPSKWEGFGIPPLEAMACGAPVIASDIPAHREVLGSAASFVTLGDSASWEAAFSDLAAGRRPLLAAGDTPPEERYTWARSGAALVAAFAAVEPGLARAHEPAEVSA